MPGGFHRTGNSQGQWLNNDSAAQFLDQHKNVEQVTTFDIPNGIGQVIRPDGSVVGASKATLVPKKSGGLKTAYPVE